MELELWSMEHQGAQEKGGAPRGRARPPPSWQDGGPPGLHLWQVFFLFSEKCLREVSGHSENFYFYKNNTMAILLKTASVQVSFIPIMQIRVQNKGKSVWKSRYVGDVSTPPSLNLCLSSSNSVDKLKLKEKNFYELFCSCLHK